MKHFDNGYEKFPPVDCDDSPSKELFNKNGYFDQLMPGEELYDLMLDPQEGNNLAYNPSYQFALSDMRRRLSDWQAVSNDPLLSGKMTLPEGAICSTPDSYSTSTQVILPECRQYLAALKAGMHVRYNYK